MEAFADRAAVREMGRRLVAERRLDVLADVRQLVHLFVSPAHPGRFALLDPPADRRQAGQRAAQPDDVSRCGRAECDLGQKPFDIEDGLEFLPQFRAGDDLAVQVGDAVAAGLDLGAVDRRPQQPLPQQARAHRCLCLVDHPQQRRLRRAAEQRLDQLQIPHRHRIERHPVLLAVVGRRIEVLQRAALRVADVVQHRSRGGNRGGTVRGPQPVENVQLELVPQRALGVGGLENPRFEFRPQVAVRGSHGVGFVGEQRTRRREQHFLGAEMSQRILDVFCVQFRHAELARRDIDVGEPGRVAFLGHGGQVVVLAGAQQARVAGRAGRHDARHFAAHELPGLVRVFDLIADGDAMALGDQLRDVAVGRVARHAAHRDRLALLLVAGGQRDAEVARGDDRVVVEQLVEITEMKQQQGVGYVAFDRVVLPHQRRFGLRSHDTIRNYTQRSRDRPQETLSR